MTRAPFTLRPAPLVAAALCLLHAAGCGAGAPGAGPAAIPRLAVGAESFVVEAFTDADDIRAVAATDTQVFVGTDSGLHVFARGAAERAAWVGVADGLPSADVTALAPAADGSVWVATAAGMARWRKQVVESAPAPPVGRARRLAFDASGSLWACGAGGLAKRIDRAWALFGDRFGCTALALSPSGVLWVGTTEGALAVSGDVVREHRLGRGLPGSFVRDLAALDGTRTLALVDADDGAVLALHDGARWHAHALPADRGAPWSLVSVAGGALVLAERGAWRVSRRGRADGEPVPLLDMPEVARTRAFRGDLRRDPAPDLAADDARARVVRPAVPWVRGGAREDLVSELVFAEAALPAGLRGTAAASAGEALVLGTRGQGTWTVFGEAGPVAHRTRSAAGVASLEVGVDTAGATVLRTADGRLVVRRGAAEAFVAGPEGARIEALAFDRGAPVVATVGGLAQDEIALHRWDGAAWAPVLSRVVEGRTLAALAGLVVDAGGLACVGVRVPDGAGTKPGGAVCLASDAPAAIEYRAAIAPAPGQRSKPAPDDLSRPVLGESGMVWWSGVDGATRIGGDQVVRFGEARGVPGEVVTDVAFVPPSRVWIAAAEGLGTYDGSAMRFSDVPRHIVARRSVALDVGPDGRLWAAGPKGLVFERGGAWTAVDGLPGPFRDVRALPNGEVWLLGEQTITVLRP